MSRTAASAAVFFDGDPPFEQQLPTGQDAWRARAALGVPIVNPPEEVARAVKALPAATAAEIAGVIGRADTAALVYQRDTRKTVRFELARTGLLDDEHALDVLDEMAATGSSSPWTSVWKIADGIDPHTVIARFRQGRLRHLPAVLAHAAGRLADPDVFLEVLNHTAPVSHSPILEQVKTQVDELDFDVDGWMSVANSAGKPWGSEELADTAYDRALQQVLASDDPQTWEAAARWPTLAAALVVPALESDRPVELGALLHHPAGRVNVQVGTIVSALLDSDVPIPFDVARRIWGGARTAISVVKDQDTDVRGELTELVRRFDRYAAGWLAQRTDDRDAVLALHCPALDPPARAELIERTPTSDLPVGVLTDDEIAVVVARSRQAGSSRAEADAKRLLTNPDGKVRLPEVVARELLQLRPRPVSVINTVTEWSAHLLEVFAEIDPGGLPLLVHRPSVTVFPPQVRARLIAHLEPNTLAMCLTGRSNITLTVDEIVTLRETAPAVVDQAVEQWSQLAEPTDRPAWLASALDGFEGCPEEFGPPLTQVLLERAQARFGRDRERWELLLTLAPTWQGTIDGLIDTAEDLT